MTEASEPVTLDAPAPAADPTSEADPEASLAPPVTLRTVVFGGGPRFLRDGFGPVLAFYVGWKVAGLAVGIVASSVVALLAYRMARKQERDGALVKLAIGLVFVQAIIGLVSGSTRVYLAQPVLLNGALGIAFLASAFTRRPIIGIFACETYPFPDEVRESETFRSIFARASIVWGVYQLLRSAMRLLILSQSSVDAYVLVNFLTGVPLMSAMFTWTAWYSVRGFRRSAEWGPSIAALDELEVARPDPADPAIQPA